MSFTDLVQATKAALLLDPAQAVAKFEAHHDLVGPCEVTVKVGSGHKFTVDELEALGASNMAANPVEYALAALGSCQAITYRVWAAQLDVKLDKVAIPLGLNSLYRNGDACSQSGCRSAAAPRRGVANLSSSGSSRSRHSSEPAQVAPSRTYVSAYHCDAAAR